MAARLLVVDDEESMCKFMEIMLTREGYQVATVMSGKAAVELLQENEYDLIFADLNMPGMSGLDVLKEARSIKNDQDLIVMTAYASVDTAIEAMKQGAVDYITKPFKVDEIKLAIDKSISRKKLETENATLKKHVQGEHSFDNFIGTSESVALLKKLAQRVAGTDSTVLVLGESGTGKDLIAQAIHQHSARSEEPFVTINCAALPETLLESELFGHRKGSFTGAIKDKDGLFKAADKGTLFLDEVGNTSLTIQVKLLRVLEDKRITPVGDTRPFEVDVRLIAATNSDLEAEVKAGKFRTDLYYRLNVLPIHIPPLRERREDIELLVDHFITLYCLRLQLPKKAISPEALILLREYHWPGNVRELENTIERAALLNRSDSLEISDFPERLRQAEPTPVVTSETPNTPTLELIEKAYIEYVLNQSSGKKTDAAKVLGIDVSTLYRKLDRYKSTGKSDPSHIKSDDESK